MLIEHKSCNIHLMKYAVAIVGPTIHLKASSPLIIFDQVALLEDSGSSVHQVHPTHL